MRFLADMGVNLHVVEWLRSQGHDAAHLREEELERLPDQDIFSKAVAENRIVLTFDLGFGEVAALSAGRKVGVVLFRLHNTRTPNVIERLGAALAGCSHALEAGGVVLVEESRLRVRQFLEHGEDPDHLWYAAEGTT